MLLIVDSDAERRSAAAEILQKAGYRTIETESADEALEMCRALKPRLAIVAVRRPADPGDAVCRRVKRDESFAHIFVLQILSDPPENAGDSCGDAETPADAALSEPYSPRNLVAMVKTLLRLLETQNDLQLKEDRYRAFIEQSGEGIWRFELDEPVETDLPVGEQIERMYQGGWLAECNDAMARQYGFDSAADLSGVRLGDLLVPEDPTNYEYLRSFIESGYRLTEAESHEKDESGKDKYFLNNLIGIVSGGKLLRAWGTQRDITARRDAEQRLRRANEQFRIAEQASNGFLYDWNPITRRVERSDAITRILGYNSGEIAPDETAWLDLIHPDDREPAERGLRSAVRSGRGYLIECRVRHKNGEWINVWDRGLVVRDDAGRAVRVVGTVADISDVKQAQARFRESEERFRLLAENLDDVFWIFNWREKRREYLSPAFNRMFGFDRDSILAGYQNWNDVVHPDDREASQRALWGIEETGRYDHEYRVILPGGEIRWLHDKGLPIRDAKGEIVRVVGAAEDITERKQTEAMLHSSRKQLELSTQAAQIGAWQWNIRTNKIFWSAIHQQLWGYGAVEGEIDYEDWRRRIQPEDLQMAENEIAIALRDRSTYDIEYRVFPADGAPVRWIRSVGQVVYDQHGEAVQMLGISTDITKRRANEDEILRLNQELQKRVEEQQKLLDILPVGVSIANDAACQDLYANRYLTEILGLNRDSNISVSNSENSAQIGWKLLRAGEDISDAELPIQLAIAAQETVKEIEFDVLMPHSSKPISFLGSASPLFDERGAVRGAVGGFLDITERKKAEREREELLEREQKARADAELANRSKDEFLAVLSHELRTPLNSMFGWVRMLSAGQLDAEKTKRAVEVIERNINVQTKLIEDILDVSRIISGKIRLERRQIDFAHLVASVADLTRPVAEAKNVRLEIADAPAGCIVECDPERMQQVIGNLLSNAVKFTAGGGLVKISLDCRDNVAELSVADTGIGIAPQFLPYVFDRFRQADGSSKRKHGGLGLGLAIVKHLIELHGGAVGAISAGENEGATFTVRLPMQLRRETPVFAASDQAENYNGGGKLGGKRILLVDDDRDALEMLRTMLAAHGAEVTSADSALEALPLVEQQNFDLLVSDIGMPAMDGIEFIGRLRESKNAGVARLPAIALTAYVGAEDRQRILAAGFQKYLPKPISFAELLSTINGILPVER